MALAMITGPARVLRLFSSVLLVALPVIHCRTPPGTSFTRGIFEGSPGIEHSLALLRVQKRNKLWQFSDFLLWSDGNC